jgi:hypothetical protein
VWKVTDQGALAGIVKTDNDFGVRMNAARHVTDQTVLAVVAKTDSEPGVRRVAVEKLTDQTLLADVAKTDNDTRVREAAVRNPSLTHQSVLAQIANANEVGDVREAAVEKLTDQALLADIAKNNSESGVRWRAVPKLTDQIVLADIAMNDRDREVRQRAVDKLTDQAALANIARTNSESRVRYSAAWRLIVRRGAGCPSTGEKLAVSLKSGRVASELFFTSDLDAQHQAGIRTVVDNVAKSALRTMGLNLSEDESQDEAVVDITAFGDPRHASYTSQFLRGIPGVGGSKRYSGATWHGAVRIFLRGACICSRTFDGEIEPPEQISGGAYTKESDAPFEEALTIGVAEAMVLLAEDLFGQAGIERLAQADGNSSVRTAAQRGLEELKAGR